MTKQNVVCEKHRGKHPKRNDCAFPHFAGPPAPGPGFTRATMLEMDRRAMEQLTALGIELGK